MKATLKAAATVILAAGLIGSNAYSRVPSAPEKWKTATKKQQKPTVEEQIQSLRQEL